MANTTIFLRRWFPGLIASAMALCAPSAYGWGSGHATEARMVIESLPKEIKEFFTPELLQQVVREYCMYPDAMKGYDLQLLGQETVDETVRLKFHGRSLHSEYNVAICFSFLTRAFEQKNAKHAAVWLGALIHAVGDQGAHLGPLTYVTETARFKTVKWGKGLGEVWQIENAAGLARVKKLMAGFEPKAFAGTPDEVIKRTILVAHEQMDCGARVTGRLCATFDVDASESVKADGEQAMAELAAFQVQSMLNVAATAWQFAKDKKSAKLDEKGIKDGLEEARAWVDKKPLANDTIYAGLLEAKPAGAAFGVIVEPSVCMERSYFGYCAQMVQAQIMRTLKNGSVPYVAVDIRTVLKEGLPAVEKVPAIILVSGSMYCDRAAFAKYVKGGGKVLYIAGRDAGLLGKLSASLKPADAKLLPVSMKYSDPNKEVVEKVSVQFLDAFESLGKKPRKFVNNPSTGGWTTPRCEHAVVSDDPDIRKLVTISNGSQSMTAAAALMESGKARHVFLPQYLLWVCVLSQDQTVQFSQPQLDSVGTRLLLEAARLLAPELMPQK